MAMNGWDQFATGGVSTGRKMGGLTMVRKRPTRRKRRPGDIWAQLSVSACVLLLPPLVMAAGVMVFGSSSPPGQQVAVQGSRGTASGRRERVGLAGTTQLRPRKRRDATCHQREGSACRAASGIRATNGRRTARAHRPGCGREGHRAVFGCATGDPRQYREGQRAIRNAPRSGPRLRPRRLGTPVPQSRKTRQPPREVAALEAEAGWGGKSRARSIGGDTNARDR